MEAKVFLLCVLIQALCPTLFCLTEIPVGHLKPLGSHTKAGEVEERNDVPSPEEFWTKYVRLSKPVVLRGVGKESPLFQKWTDDYIKQHFGNLEVRLEGKREKSSGIPIGAKGVGRDTLENFVDTYHDNDSNKYIVSELPRPMYDDVMVPSCLSCGTFAERLVEIDLWMSGGNSKSILHKDAFNTLNCLFNGTKDWKLIEYKYEDKIYKAWEPEYEVGGFSRINPEKVNLLKFPKIAEVPWSFVTVKAGDCLFLPKSMYHQVNSYGTHNLAIAILFSRFDHRKKLNFKNCDDPKSKPLSHFDVDWQYPGYGKMTMGNQDLASFKNMLIQSFPKQIRERDVKEYIHESMHYTPSERSNTSVANKKDLFFKAFGLTPSDIVQRASIRSLPKDKLRKLSTALSPEDPSNDYNHEYSYIDSDTLREKVNKLVQGGSLERSIFVDSYIQDLGGTTEFAHRFFDSLAGVSTQSVSIATVKSNIDSALKPYISMQRIPIPTPDGEESNPEKDAGDEEGEIDKAYEHQRHDENDDERNDVDNEDDNDDDENHYEVRNVNKEGKSKESEIKKKSSIKEKKRKDEL